MGHWRPFDRRWHSDGNTMVIRALAPEEYGCLTQVEEGVVPDPENSRVVVAIDNDKVVGRAMIVAMPHLEGTWVAPDARGGTVGYRLERAVCEEAREAGLKKLMAFSTDPKHTQYLQRLGWRAETYTVLSKEL